MTDKPLLCHLGLHKWSAWLGGWNELKDLRSQERACKRCPKEQRRKQVKVWVDD